MGNGGTTVVRYEILGSLEVIHEGRICTPTPPKVRTVLALLVMRANRVVLVDSIIRELWGDDPARSAVTTVQTYIYHLRKLFAKEGIETPERTVLESRARGYLLRVEPGQLDAEVFETMLDQGRSHIESDRPEEGAEVLRRALAMWTGPVGANVTFGPALEAHAIHLQEQWIRALELRIQADITLGRHRELIGELRYLVGTYPLNEWFHRQLIVALSRSGRRGEALQAYHHLRRVLSEELGLDPSPDLQRLQREVLAAGGPLRPGLARAS
ncbi:AfsR/SARP family transcriptional regulator [Micromonospora vinacea]|uniref:AfsR/SARP family transcriptional regulator n=1 Tax=Micromonospora vinacea TaxID=709878 RepID=UPI0034541DF4